MADWGSVSSVAWVQPIQNSLQKPSTMRTLVGAEGGVTSLVASVVSVTSLLVDALPLKSWARTVNVYDVEGVRCRTTTLVSLYQFTCSVTCTPLAKMRYPTKY